MPKRVFTDSELLDRGSEIFANELAGDEILDQYYRGFIGDSDLMDRIRFLKHVANKRAESSLEQEAEDSFERDMPLYGDSGVA